MLVILFFVVIGNIYAQTYYNGDGGKNITLAVLEPTGKNFTKDEQWILPLVQGTFNTNFNKYSAINIVDRQNLDKILTQQQESASGNYSESSYISIGKLSNARYILIGTITKTPSNSFMLEFSVSDVEAGKRVASFGPKPYAVSALENLSAIQEASADLLDQLGVKLTDAGKRSMTTVADDKQIQAETALSKGIIAQKSGTVVEAFAYYLQAVNYNPTSAEIVSRLDIVNADVTSSSMGKDIRNAIAWRKAWVERLNECDQFVAGYVKNTPLTTTLIYSADFKQGDIDWDKETIPISVDVCLTPYESWPVPITGVVNAVYEGFAGTGQAAAWKLDWPLKNASGGASQVIPSKEVKYNLVLDLLNDRGVVLGRQGVTFSSGWNIEFQDGKSVGVKIQTPQTVTYPSVDANKISETLAIRVASINGRIVNAASGDNVAVKAMTGDNYKKATAGTIVFPNFVWINSGTFIMGSPSNEPDRNVSEGPQHQVTVSGFYMGMYEVTQKEYQEIMGTNPSYFKGNNLPVENVSWYDTIEYCIKRSQKEGLTPAYTRNGNNVTWNRNADGYRLPTEAEWEYACRAGTTTAYNTGTIINNNSAWYGANSSGNTHPVGQKSANAWGLYDMNGNVWEWCWDWDWVGDYTSGSQIDPIGSVTGYGRALRGGCWLLNNLPLRSANRNREPPAYRASNLGFRLVRF